MNRQQINHRTHLRTSLLGLVILALALAGCVAQAGSGQTANLTPTAVPTTAQAMPTATQAAPAAGGPAGVMVATDPTLGAHLVDAQGMSLYLFEKDSANTSACNDSCTAIWPPLLTTGQPVAQTGADASLLGTTTRTDGTSQVTYNGHPLYHYAKDQKPGDVNGQGIGGLWYLVSPTGDKIGTGSS